jgi:hypothetical protein
MVARKTLALAARFGGTFLDQRDRLVDGGFQLVRMLTEWISGGA